MLVARAAELRTVRRSQNRHRMLDSLDLSRAEVLERIATALSSTLGVREAAYFGSIATGGVDFLSDIDLVVQCDGEAASRFVRRLHEIVGFVLYRSFSDDRWPAGRYWFRFANPFLRLDLSFYGEADFQRLLTDGIGPKKPPFLPLPLGTARVFVEPSRALPTWSDEDRNFGGALRRFHESAKAVARGQEPRLALEAAEKAVQRFASIKLAPGVWDLYEGSLRYFRSSA